MNTINSTILRTTPPNEILSTMRTWLSDTLGEAYDFMLPELAEMYLEDAPMLISSIESAIDAQDGLRLKETAHTLKGSSASMGFTMFASICQEIESFAKANNISGAATRLPQAKAELMSIMGVLEGIV